ncbi:hypothetical protein Hamer_G003106 [Homarus americanus]|uniref:Uncharacterized protein n=1 Tax=Homarus americanus TaxID=6706 RepID=A0A8J5N6N7_HOMAM|nr:hypothetical protein Hamer_G003106 [Homarus americanus]
MTFLVSRKLMPTSTQPLTSGNSPSPPNSTMEDMSADDPPCLSRCLRLKLIVSTYKEFSSPGESIIQATIVPISIMTAYIMRVEVEFLHDGQAEQHKLHAADPQQQASCK